MYLICLALYFLRPLSRSFIFTFTHTSATEFLPHSYRTRIEYAGYQGSRYHFRPYLL